MKRKIMLIDPYFKEGLKGFPLGLAYIAGALRKEHDVSVLDLTGRSFVEGRDHGEILREELDKSQPDLVGITSTSPTHRQAIDVAREVKRFRDIPVIKGGAHETNCAETTIRNNPEVDYSIIGEGEETVVELVDALASGKSVRGMKGVVYREGDQIINNGRRPLINNLDTLPRPARDLFYTEEEYEKYYSASLFGGKKSTSIMTSRGCPYSCSFCSSKANWGNIRKRTVGNVVDELEELVQEGFGGFMFEDDMSLANKKWFLDFSRELRKRGLGIQYSLQTRADAVNPEIMKNLADSGCTFMYFGIESGVQDILDKCGKGITLDEARKAFQLAKEHGVRSMASIQFGLEGEDLERLSTVRETIRTLNEDLRPDEVAVSYTCLYPGSPLANSEGITPESYEHYTRTKADEEIYTKTAHGSYSVHPKGLTPEKIHEIEETLDRELKVKRFQVGTFYKT